MAAAGHVVDTYFTNMIHKERRLSIRYSVKISLTVLVSTTLTVKINNEMLLPQGEAKSKPSLIGTLKAKFQTSVNKF